MSRLGIDIGSTTVKAVLLNDDSDEIVSSIILPTGNSPVETAKTAALKVSDGDLPTDICATGYGRKIAPFAIKDITEITCHAAGVKAMHPNAATIIDIGGQDSKAIRLDARGGVLDFAMNDKCAAGTGSFLDSIARRFELTLEQVAQKCLQSDNPLPISATCVVFAESEVIGLLTQGHDLADIISGIHASIAARISRLYAQVQGCGPVYFSGGVAKNEGMILALSRELSTEVKAAHEPQLMGAYGAALLA